MKARLTELKRERGYKLDTLLSSLQHSILRGYDFAAPNAGIFIALTQIEAEIRALEYLVKVEKP